MHAKKYYIWNPSTCVTIFNKYYWLSDYGWQNCKRIIKCTKKIGQQMLSLLCQQVRYRKSVRHKMNCYILHTVLLLMVLLFIIPVACYNYAKHRSKLNYNITMYKWRIMNF